MDLILDLLGITVCLLLLGNAQLYGASILIHHTGHGQGIRPKRLGRWIAELTGILLLRQSVSQYMRTHWNHHGKATFARGDTDPDAAFIQRLGFRLGDSVEASNRRLWQVLFSPGVHGNMIRKRVLMNFARKAEPLRTLIAWLVWSFIVFVVWKNEVLPAFGLLLLFALLFGNISTMLELFSEHLWFIEVSNEQNRQWALSHARFYGAIPPEQGASFRLWLIWVGETLLAVCEKLLVGAGDLPVHAAHHVGWDRDDFEGQPAWANPQFAYAPYITKLDGKIYWSTNSAIQAWFDELAKARGDNPK